MPPKITNSKRRRLWRGLGILGGGVLLEAVSWGISAFWIPSYDYLFDPFTYRARFIRDSLITQGFDDYPDLGLRIRINSEGYRGADFLPDPHGVRTIACVGNGALFGGLIPDEATWPAQLQELLNRDGNQSFVVWNLGTEGAGAAYGRDFLFPQALTLRPQYLVLAFGGLNDALRGVAGEREYLRHSGTFWSLARSFSTFQLLERGGYRLRNRWNGGGLVPRVALEEFRADLRFMVATAREKGITTILLNETVQALDLPGYFSRKEMEAYRQVVKGLAGEFGLSEVDPETVLPEVQRNRYYQFNKILYSSEGNRLIAMALAEAVRVM